MEEMREYRRREVRRVKNVFQSSAVAGCVGRVVLAVFWAAVVVEALRTRHREGVKKEEGVEVVEGGLAARTESLERDITRVLMDGKAAVDERLRLGLEVDVVKKGTARGPGPAMGR